jgi:c-di-GMP-binding flagellar brake protein YcgR
MAVEQSTMKARPANSDSIENEPPLPQNPSPPERRNHSRLMVDDSSTIILVKIAARLVGRIVDISIGGCRIRCHERFPVGIYTRVETEFRIEGLPFRLGGVVQAIHDRHTVGIRFLDMSSRKREQLEQLIEEIEEAQRQSETPETTTDAG